jgi:predicted Zn-dependent protease
MRGAVRLVVATPALLAFAWAALCAQRFGSTESVVYDAGKEMATWRVQPGRQTFEWVRADLEQAVTRDPKDASLQEMLGRLALLGSHDDAATDEAIARFTSALQQRPTSPYSWASLVEALYRKGDTGARFQDALLQAAETGPWELEVQRTVADYGLAVWDEVSPSTRSKIERMVANGMVGNAPEILQISERRGRLGVACVHLGPSKRTDPKWTRNCPSTEAR